MCSSYPIQGILLILVRKPYDIGDRVSFVDPTANVNNNGPPSGGWIVEKVDLFTTTVRLAATREYTTFSNGSLADARIVNLRKSVKANAFFSLKFTISSTTDQLKTFRRRIMEYVENRPREWIKVNAFRCARVETDLQYIEYILILQHRESWQNFAAVQDSQSDVFMFALDLQKKLKMKYTAPRMPVDIQGLGDNERRRLRGNKDEEETYSTESEKGELSSLLTESKKTR
jgi:hypothetical protein